MEGRCILISQIEFRPTGLQGLDHCVKCKGKTSFLVASQTFLGIITFSIYKILAVHHILKLDIFFTGSFSELMRT